MAKFDTLKETAEIGLNSKKKDHEKLDKDTIERSGIKYHLHIEYQKVYKNRGARTDLKTCTEKLVNAVEQAVSKQDMQTQTPLPPQKKNRLAGKFQSSDKSAMDEKGNVLSMGEYILNRLKDCFGIFFF